MLAAESNRGSNRPLCHHDAAAVGARSLGNLCGMVAKVVRSTVQGRESGSVLGHNFCVTSQLDEVADRLAQEPLAVGHGSNRLLARAEERRGLIGIIAGVVGGVGMAVSAFRRHRRLTDQLTTRRLYEQATGVGDRANADLAVVADRLSPLVGAPDGPKGDALVRGASRRLVAWVAGGRSGDEEMSAVEAAFARWVQLALDDAAPEAIVDSLGSYVDAWDAATRRTG